MRRRFEQAVRLEVEESMSSDVLDKLVTELGVDTRAVYRVPGPLDLSGLNAIADLDLPQLKYPPFVPSETALPTDMSIFTEIAEHDVLVHHPYDSFAASTQRLVVSAAADPRVLAIKHTLYRTSGDSEIVDALIDAAEAGKQVVVVVEIKARFDERANIAWAHKLEEAGCHVVYGFVGLKTHCKMILVVREEADGSLRRFCHIGTGNYHPKTARMYEDFGLLTADPTVGEDVTDLFNHLTGYSRQSDYRRLLVAPEGIRSGLVEQIHRQTERARAGQPARIQMKCNAIIDEVIIDSLYRASQAGVPVDLWVRGICGVRPGMPGMSETIRVRSVLGRFLEHSRIYAFGTGDEDDDGDVWIGSADLMHRNLDRRVETLVRVTDRAHAGRVARPDRHGHGRHDIVVVAGLRRHLDPASPGRLRRPPQRHAGVPDPDPAGPRRRWLTARPATRSGRPAPCCGGRQVRAAVAAVGPGQGGGADPPAQVRRLDLPQGEARPGRARAADRRPRGGRGDRAARHPRQAADPGPLRPRGRPKRVDYWVARSVPGGPDSFQANDEVDALEWLPVPAARGRLSYPHDAADAGRVHRRARRHRPVRAAAARLRGRQGHLEGATTWTGRWTPRARPSPIFSPCCWPATAPAA